METKKYMLHLFWNCYLVQHCWFYVKNCFKDLCYYSFIECNDDISWHIKETLWESKYSKWYFINFKIYASYV